MAVGPAKRLGGAERATFLTSGRSGHPLPVGSCGAVRALLPEHNPNSIHGHVVHLVEVPRAAPPAVPADEETPGATRGQPPAAAEPTVAELIPTLLGSLKPAS